MHQCDLTHRKPQEQPHLALQCRSAVWIAALGVLSASYNTKKWPDLLLFSDCCFPLFLSQSYILLHIVLVKFLYIILFFVLPPVSMHLSFLTNITIVLSMFHLVASAPEPNFSAATLQARQVSATPSQADLCLDYERTANMSTVGANGSYRTVLLQKSNVGTIFNARMMDAAIAKLPQLTADRTLNMVCGNWTEIAFREAEANFTQGIVAQFTTKGLPVGIKAGPEVPLVISVICVLFSVVWVFSG